ncbi:hypothetical protein BDA99DRAFT_528326 [Phascolomyces articulosus]|uniref:F-box domain-containing protein n=1 Tax=Phascolomyces articulosus TaxID=60185 RepID=A0AAD5JXC8_9FUNG|nr:hypothetical protein BDA99DRAFT_528326 [Phascolomyces articulosus]
MSTQSNNNLNRTTNDITENVNISNYDTRIPYQQQKKNKKFSRFLSTIPTTTEEKKSFVKKRHTVFSTISKGISKKLLQAIILPSSDHTAERDSDHHQQDQRRRGATAVSLHTEMTRQQQMWEVDHPYPAQTHKRIQQSHFPLILPYDILYLIFDKLEFRDLLRCATVSPEWRNFVIEWPEFWCRLSIETPYNNAGKTASDALKHGKIKEFRLAGPMQIDLLRDILAFLSCMKDHYIENLYFINMTIKDNDIPLFVRVLQRPVKLVEFIDCHLSKNQVIDPIVSSCLHVTHVAFSQTDVAPVVYNVKRPTRAQSLLLLPNVQYPWLTYLKLSFEYQHRLYEPEVPTARLSGIIRKSPNLVHLFLDSGGSVHQGHCIRQAIKYCPKLQNLIVSDRATMPTTVLSNITNNEIFPPTTTETVSTNTTAATTTSTNCTTMSSSSLLDQQELMTTTTKNTHISATSPGGEGLRRFVLTGGNIRHERDDIISVFNKAYKTIQLLYLHYGYGFTGPSALYKLARQDEVLSHLREIRLSTEHIISMSSSEPPFAKAMAALLRRCPSLEVLIFIDTFSPRVTPEHYIYMDDEILMTLAEYCSHLTYLRCVGPRWYSSKVLLDFATRIGSKKIDSKLYYLEMDMERKIILPLIKKVQSIRHLHVRKDTDHLEKPMLIAEKKVAQQILQERDGSLILIV